MQKRMRAANALGFMVAGATAWCVDLAWAGPPTSVTVIARVGDMPSGGKGGTISSLNAPFTNADGKAGFTGGISGQHFVWYDADIIWLSQHGLPDVLTGAEGTMGVSNSGGFIYSPSVNGNDSVWGSDGLLLQETDAAPGFPAMFSSFNSRPTMTPFNVAHWVGGAAATSGGSSVQRSLYRRTADSGTIFPILTTGDVIGGLTISSPSGIEFDYSVSDSVEHYIVVCDTTAATAVDQIVVLNGALALREGDAATPTENWQAFDIVSVNDAGNWIVTGDTNGAAASDEFIAYNGTIVTREGETLDGVTVASGASLRAASINNLNRVAHIWGWGSGATAQEHLFVGDAADLSASSVRLLSLGEAVDITGDAVADATITDFEASTVVSPGLDFSDHDFVFIEVTLLDDSATEFEAIIRVDIPSAIPCPADITLDGNVAVEDLLAVINGWGSGAGHPADVNGDDTVDVQDLLAVIAAWGPCP